MGSERPPFNGVVFLCRLTHRNVAGRAGDPLFGEEEAEGQNQEFAPQLAAVTVAQDREAQVVAWAEEMDFCICENAPYVLGHYGRECGFAGVEVDGKRIDLCTRSAQSLDANLADLGNLPQVLAADGLRLQAQALARWRLGLYHSFH